LNRQLKIKKPDLYEKLNNIEKSSSETDSKSSDSNEEDNLSNELNVDSSSDSSSDDSMKNALKNVDPSKLILENKNEDNLKVSKGKENKKLKKDDSLETLLNISDKKIKIKKVESSDSLEKLLGGSNKNETSGSESSDSSDPKKDITKEPDQKEVEIISDKEIGTKKFYDILYGFYGQRNKKINNTKEKETIDPSGLIKSYGISFDTNIAGLKKSKDKNWENRYRNFQTNSKQVQYEMQDTHYCECQFYNESALFCVFDGHLGANCSRDLVTIFPRSLKQYFKDIITNIDDIQYAWKTLYLNVDNSLKQYEVEGSTATTVFIWKSKGKKFLQCANVGDSTAFLYRSVVPVPLSKDHKLNNQSGERERLLRMGIHVEMGANRVEGGLNVTRAFGDFYPKENGSGIISEPEVSPLIELTDQDTHIIIASDGLWDVVTPEDAYTIISEFDDSKIMSHQLLNTAVLNQNCKDNVTVIVVSLL